MLMDYLVRIIQNSKKKKNNKKTKIQGYNRTKVFQEEKIKFYANNEFYIYKSNKLGDWTRFLAIKDANEEIELFFKKLGEI